MKNDFYGAFDTEVCGRALRLIDADPGEIGVDLTLSALSHRRFGTIAVRMHSEAELVEARWVNYEVPDDSAD